MKSIFLFLAPALLLPACALAAPVCNVDYLGDSITAGIGTQNSQTQGAPCVANYYVQKGLGEGAMVYGSAQGHPGHTTADFAPGGNDFTLGEAAAKQLQAEHPGLLVFSIMLGINDCANHGPFGAPMSSADYSKNLHAILDKLLADFPDAKIVVHHSSWFSPNLHNGADYEGSAPPDRLRSYFAVIDRLPADYGAAHPGHVFVGDTDAYNYFSIHFQNELNPEMGANGTFFVHPNAAGGQSLGKLWAAAILKAFK